MFLVNEDGSLVSIDDEQMLSFADFSADNSTMRSRESIGSDVVGTVRALANDVHKLQQRLEFSISLQAEMLRRLTLTNVAVPSTSSSKTIAAPEAEWPQFKIIDTYEDALAFEEKLNEPSFVEQNVSYIYDFFRIFFFRIWRFIL